MKKLILTLIFFFFGISAANADFEPAKILSSMSLREKVGQLFIIRPDYLNTSLKIESVDNFQAEGVKSLSAPMFETLKQYPAGGFILFAKNIDTPIELKNFTKALKDSSEIFPFIAVDEEGGRVARIANSKKFHVKKFRNAEYMAKKGISREAGSTIGAYLKEFGFNFDLAPVADINTNPKNIVIGKRAFGNKPSTVSKNVSEFLDGLHSQGIAGSIKHFPGHGDTRKDTHKSSVMINKNWNKLLKAEIIPFLENFEKTDSVMIAHITLKNVTKDNLPATLSYELVTGKLRNELNYDGIIITDGRC